MTREQLAKFLQEENQYQSALDALDNRELEVVSMMSQGQAGRQICDEMRITGEELAQIKSEIQAKCGLKDEVQLLRFAAQQRTASASGI
jgi:DNA-binding NarL/FixJ family response regulator